MSLNQLRQTMARSRFEIEAQSRKINLITKILYTLLGFTLLTTGLTVIMPSDNPARDQLIRGILILFTLGLRILVQFKHIDVSSFLLSGLILFVTTYSIWTGDGLNGAAIGGYFVFIIIAGTLLGHHAALAAGGVSILTTLGVLLLTPDPETEGFFASWVILSFTLTITALLLYFSLKNLQMSLTHTAQAEQALQDSETHYQTLIENSSDIFGVIGADGIIGYQSPSTEHVLGYVPEALVGKNIFYFVPVEEQALLKVAMEKSLASPYVTDLIEGRFRHQDGTYLHLEATIRYVPELDGLILNSRDVTNRVKMEKALRESRERFRVVSELTSDFAYAVRVEEDGTLISEWVTDACKRITGFTIEEIQTQGWPGLLHPEDLPIAQQHLARHLEGHSDVAEYRIITKQGETRWIRNHGKPIWDEAQGRVVRLFNAAQDITDHKIAEAALKESEARFRSVYSQSPIGIEVYDSEGYLIGANPACLEIFGVKNLNAVRGFQLFADPNLPDAAKQRLLEGKPVRYEVNFDFDLVKSAQLYETSKSGHCYIDCFITPWGTEGGQGGFMVHLRDITARRKAEQAIQGQNKVLAQLNRTKENLLSEVNHRTGNNLTAIIGLLQAERRHVRGTMTSNPPSPSQVSPECQAMVESMLDRLIQRITGLIEAHKLLSRSQWAPVRLNHLTEQVIQATSKDPTVGQMITVDIQPADITVSPRQTSNLALIINELAMNSLQHGRVANEPLRVGVRLTQPNADTILLEYRDNGPGYPDTILHKTGYNVGLYLVQQLILGLRGTVTFANDQGAVTALEFEVEEGSVT